MPNARHITDRRPGSPRWPLANRRPDPYHGRRLAASMKTRLYFIDNIRWSMIILVLSMHASDTYSPFGNWYYTDRQHLSLGGRVFFATYQSYLQGFFMALLFFISAYFAPASCDRKGAAHYVRDRFVRLMVPTLLYIIAIGPLTGALAAFAASALIFRQIPYLRRVPRRCIWSSRPM